MREIDRVAGNRHGRLRRPLNVFEKDVSRGGTPNFLPPNKGEKCGREQEYFREHYRVYIVNDRVQHESITYLPPTCSQ